MLTNANMFLVSQEGLEKYKNLISFTLLRRVSNTPNHGTGNMTKTHLGILCVRRKRDPGLKFVLQMCS